MAGPIAASLMLGSGMAIKDIFLWALLPAILCFTFALMLKEPQTHEAKTAKPFDWRLGDMPPVFKRYLVVALFTLGNSSNMFLLLHAKGLGVPEAQVPLLWAAVSAGAMIFITHLSGLSDRVGRVRLLVAGYVAYGLFYVGLGTMAQSGVLLFAFFAFYGLFMAATEGVEKALVADIAPADQRGTAFGWFNLTAGVFLFPASVVFGWIYQSISPLAAFGFSGGCALLAAALLLGWVNVAVAA